MLGYKIFFIVVMVATIPAFIITKLVPFRYDDKGKLLEAEEDALMAPDKDIV